MYNLKKAKINQNFPITIINAKEQKAFFGVDGKSEQATRSGKNLFDYNSYTYDKTIQNSYRFIEIKDLKPNTIYVISNYQDLTNSGFDNVYMARDAKYSSIIFANLVGNNNVPINTDETGKLYLCAYASSWTEELWNTFISYFENAQLEERKNTNFIRTIRSFSIS